MLLLLLLSCSYALSTLFSASRVAGTASQLVYALAMLPGFLLPVLRPYGSAAWCVRTAHVTQTYAQTQTHTVL